MMTSPINKLMTSSVIEGINMDPTVSNIKWNNKFDLIKLEMTLF